MHLLEIKSVVRTMYGVRLFTELGQVLWEVPNGETPFLTARGIVTGLKQFDIVAIDVCVLREESRMAKLPMGSPLTRIGLPYRVASFAETVGRYRVEVQRRPGGFAVVRYKNNVETSSDLHVVHKRALDYAQSECERLKNGY